ncbi:pre-mRNA-splicing factor CWC25 homolog [Malaya genurostris]|uniref:pre-mRNA-splicing factor CWC25 homolog n=1 Tax=Malaya genurostris TaxID=325434 RepID=UPI0026F3F124|nr:pre-mRNA-splicing factor CWC25 homolog [Malaya genurostris]
MGGGDLNTKKSWHPNTFKNQERVWKAEQADAAEKRKLAELQHEINEERNREELKSIAKKSGLIEDTDGDRKLEWMYKGPQVNREEYLLGRTVDKTFEQLDAQEKAGPSVGISQPKNHVEHECIPFSIRQYKGLEGMEQVDMARKLMEDPLMAIKQKEVESRQKILENPVKLKELHRLLKSDRSIQDRAEKKSKKKKSKKQRKSNGTDSDEDKDLDKILAEKYKKVQTVIGAEQSEDVSLDKLLNMKYQKLSKELNKLAKHKKSKKKKRNRSSSSSADSESDSRDNRKRERRRSDSRNKYSGPSKRREQSLESDSNSRYNRRDRGRRSRSKDRYSGSSKTCNQSTEMMRHSKTYDRYHKNQDDTKRDHRRSHSRDRKYSSALRSDQSKDRNRKPPQTASSSSSSESSPQEPRRNDESDDEGRPPISRNFGLVSASGKKLELKKRDEVRLYKRDEIRAHQSSQKPSWSRPEKKKPLTEEEIEARRKAMLQNAEWRDNERQKNVRRYENEDRMQEQKDTEKKYDKDFLTKQFKHAVSNETVEKRIKSNRNNIQRTGGAMNANFARR